MTTIFAKVFPVCRINFIYKQYRESTQGYSRSKVDLRHDKIEEFGLNNWSTSKSHNGGRNQVSGRASVPCWHAEPVATAPWKPLIIGGVQARYQCHEIGGKSDWVWNHCWPRIRMSFNIRERDTSYCWIRSSYRPLNFLNDDFKRSARYPCLSSLLESRLALRIKHSYEEQARAYRISWEIKTP